MAEQKPLWNHERIFRRMNEIIDEHEKSGKPAIAALHSCNDLAYMVMYDCNAAIAERDAEIERLRREVDEAEKAQSLCYACNKEISEMANTSIPTPSAEIERLRAAIREASESILKLPTWVESNSYEAQVDMRNRASALVGNILVGVGEEAEYEINRAVVRLEMRRNERLEK